jgi:hypothetical protein
MAGLAQILRDEVDAVFAARLQDGRQRERVVAAIMAGFAGLAKKPLPDLAERTQALEARVRQLAREIKLEFVNGRVVLKVAGSAESLVKELRHGSAWYAPWEKVDETVLAAILTDPPK